MAPCEITIDGRVVKERDDVLNPGERYGVRLKNTVITWKRIDRGIPGSSERYQVSEEDAVDPENYPSQTVTISKKQPSASFYSEGFEVEATFIE